MNKINIHSVEIRLANNGYILSFYLDNDLQTMIFQSKKELLECVNNLFPEVNQKDA